LYGGAETGSPPFLQLKLLEGVNAGDTVGAAPKFFVLIKLVNAQ